jgi:hypothetical protein
MSSKGELRGPDSELTQDVVHGVSVAIAVDGDIYRHLSLQAKDELAARLAALATTILKEAQSLESADRATGAAPEIIRAHVERSWWTILLRYRKERHPRLVKVLPLLSSLCVFLMGFSLSHFKDWWGPITFVVGTVLAAVCIGTIYVLAADS